MSENAATTMVMIAAQSLETNASELCNTIPIGSPIDRQELVVA